MPFDSTISVGFTIAVQNRKRATSGAVGTKRLSTSGNQQVNRILFFFSNPDLKPFEETFPKFLKTFETSLAELKKSESQIYSDTDLIFADSAKNFEAETGKGLKLVA